MIRQDRAWLLRSSNALLEDFADTCGHLRRLPWRPAISVPPRCSMESTKDEAKDRSSIVSVADATSLDEST
ncbi:unnamed protein product [Lasius platythorax]|uniref:Uncharacterized protein n=1 Tax=Lasius platythorax TaxID=488582 RepID=A0AAV2NGA6_9HYME